MNERGSQLLHKYPLRATIMQWCKVHFLDKRVKCDQIRQLLNDKRMKVARRKQNKTKQTNEKKKSDLFFIDNIQDTLTKDVFESNKFQA